MAVAGFLGGWTIPAFADMLSLKKETLLIALYNGKNRPELIQLQKTRSHSPTQSSVPLQESLETTLGTLFHLFVYVYLADSHLSPKPYACDGKEPDAPCGCKKDRPMRMNDALLSSCGNFFHPKRLGLSSAEWSAYWSHHMHAPFEWLLDLERFNSRTKAPLSEVLKLLHQIKNNGAVFRRLLSLLPHEVIDQSGVKPMRYMGNHLRVKTFHCDLEKGNSMGGFAGWLPDGGAVWAAGEGSSPSVLKKWGKPVARHLSREPAVSSGEPLVKVRFFYRRTIKKIVQLPDNREIHSGKLVGNFQVHFRSGARVRFHSSGNFFCEPEKKSTAIYGLFSINEYVGRVIEREVETTPEEAAKAFAVVIRTFLMQNSERSRELLFIKDSPRYQYVSINAPSPEAMRISAWTDGLIIQGVKPIHYNQKKGSRNSISWWDAVHQAQKGLYFDELLKIAFRSGRIEVMEHRGK